MFSDYLIIQRNGWQCLLRKDFDPNELCSLVCGNLDERADVIKVHSSDTARVYRFSTILNGNAVTLYIKDFLSRSLLDKVKHLLRPSRAARAFKAGIMLEKNGLKYPKNAALFEKQSLFDRKNILVTEGLPQGLSLTEFIQTDAFSKNRKDFITELAKTISRMHSAGVFHGDLRGGNLFVAESGFGREFYFIDNERTKQYKRLPLGLRIKNLVQLNMLTDTVSRTDRLRFFKTYLKTCGLDEFNSNLLMQSINRKTVTRLKRRSYRHLGIPNAGVKDHGNYQRACQGNITGIFLQSFCDIASGKKLISEIDSLMEKSEVLKDDSSTRVIRCLYNNRDVVVKRYNHRGLLHSIRHTIKGSRARKCWLFGQKLIAAGIATAEPVAFIEEYRFGIIWKSYIINDYIDGLKIYWFLKQQDTELSRKRLIMAKTFDLLSRLSQNNMTHGDLKLSNILIDNDKPFLIDLDSMKLHRFLWTRMLYDRRMRNNFSRRLKIDNLQIESLERAV